MRKVNVETLAIAEINWLIAKIEFESGHSKFRIFYNSSYNPVLIWNQGGPILTKLLKEGLRVDGVHKEERKHFHDFIATFDNWRSNIYYGDHVLEAAFKCYISKVLGSEVEVPEILVEEKEKRI